MNSYGKRIDKAVNPIERIRVNLKGIIVDITAEYESNKELIEKLNLEQSELKDMKLEAENSLKKLPTFGKENK